MLIREVYIRLAVVRRGITYLTGDFFVEKVLSFYVVSGLVFCNSIEPGSGIFRKPLKTPGFKRRQKGLAGNVFGSLDLFKAKKLAKNSRYPAVLGSKQVWD